MTSHSRLAFAGALIAAVASVACQTAKTSAASDSTTSSPAPATKGDSAAISTVKNGVLANYNTTTVGKAFEGTFQNAKWSSFETPKGATVVEFNGTVTLDALEKGNQDRTWVRSMLRGSCATSLNLAEQLKQLDERERKSQNDYIERDNQINGAGLDIAQYNLRRAKEMDAAGFHGTWSEFAAKEKEQSMAVRQQEMNGIAQSLAPINSKIAECSKSTPIPLKFQFLLSADKATFDISYIDKEVFGDANGSKVLAFIYQ